MEESQLAAEQQIASLKKKSQDAVNDLSDQLDNMSKNKQKWVLNLFLNTLNTNVRVHSKADDTENVCEYLITLRAPNRTIGISLLVARRVTLLIVFVFLPQHVGKLAGTIESYFVHLGV